MLSTAQALQEWDNVRKLLIEIRSHAAAHPNDKALPTTLRDQMDSTLVPLSSKLASPVATWRQLLKHKVPYQVLLACGELMATQQHAPSFPALRVTALLVESAAAALPPPAASTSHSSSSSSSGTSSASSASNSGLTAMLWQQIEQSGLLQHLPDALSCNPNELLSQIPDQPTGIASRYLSKRNVYLLTLVEGLQKLHPSFLSAHAAGQQCVVPAIQFGMSSLHFISKAFADAGRQEWLKGWLTDAVDLANAAAYNAVALLQSLLDQQDTILTGAGSSDQQATADEASGMPLLGTQLELMGSTATSGSCSRGAALTLLQAEPILQWVCLQAVLPMLGQFLQQAAAAGTTMASSSRGDAAKSQQSAAGSMSEEQWLPASIAPAMPAAYSSILEQLGSSREVGLWLAEGLMRAGLPSNVATWDKASQRDIMTLLDNLYETAVGSLHQYSVMLQASLAFSSSELRPQPAALHLSMSAVCLQWLSDMPARGLSNPELRDGCLLVYQVAAEACKHGQGLMQLEARASPHQEQQQLVQAGIRAANQAAMSLSAAALEKLLAQCRSLPDSAGVSTGSRGSSSNSSSDTGSHANMLMQACQHVAELLATTYVIAAEPNMVGATAATPTQGNTPGVITRQLPVQPAQCCKLLQDCARLVGAAATAATIAKAAAAVTSPSNSTGEVSITMFKNPVLALLGGLKHSPDGSGTSFTGPLVASMASAGDASSPDAMQLFGMLCSLLKVYYSCHGSILEMMARNMPAGCWNTGMWDVNTAVLAAASAMLKASMDSGSPCAHPSTTRSSSSSTAGSPACTAVLPWLVLLGRCCGACALLVQHWRGNGGGSHEFASFQPMLWIMYGNEVGKDLQQLQSSLADVGQWLAAAGTVQQLNAQGYQPQNLQEQLAQATGALGNLLNDLRAVSFTGGNDDALDSFGNAASAVLKDVQQQLQAAGRMLACFAIPYACNNPACGSVGGAAEAQLVGGRSCICAGCRTARYCGKACQRAAWRQHKPVCKALAVAAAVTARLSADAASATSEA